MNENESAFMRMYQERLKGAEAITNDCVRREIEAARGRIAIRAMEDLKREGARLDRQMRFVAVAGWLLLVAYLGLGWSLRWWFLQ